MHCSALRRINSSFLWDWNGCVSFQLSCSLSSLFGQLAVHPPDPKGADFAKLFLSGTQLWPPEPRDRLSSLSPWIKSWEGSWSLTLPLSAAPRGWVLAHIGLFCLMGPWEHSALPFNDEDSWRQGVLDSPGHPGSQFTVLKKCVVEFKQVSLRSIFNRPNWD